MAKVLICPKCEYENRKDTRKCLMCSTNLKNRKQTKPSSYNAPTNEPPKEETKAGELDAELKANGITQEEDNLKELVNRPSGDTKSDESAPHQPKKKFNTVRIIIYLAIAAYWIWFAVNRCGVDTSKLVD